MYTCIYVHTHTHTHTNTHTHTHTHTHTDDLEEVQTPAAGGVWAAEAWFWFHRGAYRKLTLLLFLSFLHTYTKYQYKVSATLSKKHT
jgi:hypothetical protein